MFEGNTIASPFSHIFYNLTQDTVVLPSEIHCRDSGVLVQQTQEFSLVLIPWLQPVSTMITALATSKLTVTKTHAKPHHLPHADEFLVGRVNGISTAKLALPVTHV
ncbi:hypothetical protein KC19_7G077700 [Ceratodon purpureus]|uniref:Uncharacterized protein n=1 Tax=Ceratodon purpureus TaxID=3225 RepID=A0A8T0H8C9_CERPU|nr:hypothetical protein KC19_7G077700 [Ceratodon purpureus]